MILRTLLASVCAAAALWASAVTVNSTPGNLKEALADNLDASALTVTGQLNAADFEALGDLDNLRTLDLSAATIVAYNGDALLSGLKTVAANTLPPFSLAGLDLTELTLPANLTAIGEGALSVLKVPQITIPAGVATIGAGAFAGNEALNAITLPAATTALGSRAFQGCTSLLTANLSAAPLNVLADNTFEGCTSLTAATLNPVITAIGAEAFKNCTALASLDFPTSLESIGEKAFAASGLTAASLNSLSKLTTIGPWAFANCESLLSVSFPASLTSMGEGAFYSDSHLNLTELPENLKTIEPFALLGARSSNGMVLSNSKVERLEDYSMADWTGASVLQLPPTLNYLGNESMANWSCLDTIDAGSLREVPALGDNVWGDLDKGLVVLIVYTELENSFKAAEQWQDFNIQGTTTDNSTPLTEFDPSGNVRVRFEGKVLHVEAPMEIVGARLFDPQGRLYSLPQAIEGGTMTIDTSAYNANIMVVQVVLSNGTAATLKLFR